MVKTIKVKFGETVNVEYINQDGSKTFASLDFQAVSNKPRFTYLKNEVYILV